VTEALILGSVAGRDGGPQDATSEKQGQALSGAIGYLMPNDVLAGRQEAIRERATPCYAPGVPGPTFNLAAAGRDLDARA
jgi:hypothetical protein